MEQYVKYKNKIGYFIKPAQNSKRYIECNKRALDKGNQICRVCNTIKTILEKQSGNKVIDDFIKYTQINNDKLGAKMEVVPYDQFINIEFIAEGGFSKIYKATWVDGPINNWHRIIRHGWNITRDKNCTVALKKLNNSKNITSKELNEVRYNQYNAIL
jgi:serine/threonine protein kinase